MTLALEDVTAGYTRAPILRDFNLTVGTNETVGVLGANGAGKSTLLRLIMGSVRCWDGIVSFEGNRLNRMKPWERVRAGIAHVPEGRRIFGAMTVEENLETGALVGRSRGSDLADAYELFPRLEERRNQRAATLSGGEQQMLAIGRALMTKPTLLLVDEMSAGLAPNLVQHLVEALDRIRETGMSIVVVEQSPHVIADLADRVYLLEQGRVVGAGTFKEIGGADAIAELYLGVR